MTRHIEFAEDEYYHLYNRGVDKRKIFMTAADYRRFLMLLFIANGTRSVDIEEMNAERRNVLELERGEPLVAIGAYCLMPNHFHVLVREITGGGISKFMQKVMTGYTMYFNRLRKRSGALFQGTFKVEHASEDRYLKYLFAYIHLNPAKLVNRNWRKTGIGTKEKQYVAAYPYSSYSHYMGPSSSPSILTRDQFPGYFSTAKEFEREMHEWLDFGIEQKPEG